MRYIPIGILIVVAFLAYFLGLTDYLNLDQLAKHHLSLKNTIARHFVESSLIYVMSYIFITMLALPCDIFLVLLGGYLFPEPYSLIYVVIASSTGATALFLIARTAFGDLLFKWAGPFLKKMESGFQKNAVSYMLSLRFIPIFPFWLANIAPAFFAVSLFTYFWTTVVGVIPFAFVVTKAGIGISSIMDAHQELTLDRIFNHSVKIAFFGLGILAFLPLLIKFFTQRKTP